MKSILVIEDDENIRESLIDLLETRRYHIISAENGTEGIRLAQLHQPSLIICDVMMGGISGYDVIDSIRKSDNLSAIPFVFLSAKVMHSDKEFAIKMGANHYLTKPFRAQDLFAVVETLLKNSNGGNSDSRNSFINQFTVFLDDLIFLHHKKWKLLLG